MSELSPDARDLIAQARAQRSELLGPSAEQRAQLREKLAPLWAAQEVPPTAAASWRVKLGSVVVLVGLGLLGWLSTLPSSAPARPLQLKAANDTQPATDQRSQNANALPLHAMLAPDELAAPSTDDAASLRARDATDACPPSLSRVAGACALHSASAAAASGQPLPVAAARKTKRTERTTPQLSSAAQTSKQAPVPPAQALVPATTEPTDLLADLGLDTDERSPETRGHNERRVQRAPKETATRLPLKAADDRTTERVVQTDADPGPPSIDGELELLGAAQNALQKQRPSRALTLLQEHAFRFPTGAMVEERMAMQALALCALQRRHAAQTVLSNLEARGSQSQLLPRVRSQCGL